MGVMRRRLPRGATARTTCRLSASLLGMACTLLVLAMPALGATGAWDRTWGKDVVAGNAETGPEICTAAALCQTGQDGSGPGAGPFLFQPNKTAQRQLAPRHKLKLRVKITLKPPHHAAITRTHPVTFTQPA